MYKHMEVFLKGQYLTYRLKLTHMFQVWQGAEGRGWPWFGHLATQGQVDFCKNVWIKNIDFLFIYLLTFFFVAVFVLVKEAYVRLLLWLQVFLVIQTL